MTLSVSRITGNVESVTVSVPAVDDNSRMHVPSPIYRRIPLLWMTLGILFVFLGLVTVSDDVQFPLFLGIGLLCIARALWIYQARWKFFRTNKIKSLRSMQNIDRANTTPTKSE